MRTFLKSISVLGMGLLLCVGLVMSASKTGKAQDWCTSDACKEAEAREAESEQKSSEASAQVSSLEQEISRLGEEITQKESEIVTSQSRVSDLEQEIAKTEEKIAYQQEALAAVVVENWTEKRKQNEDTPLLRIASSESFTDYNEKQARSESAKAQISLSTNAINATKAQLEEQRQQMENLLAAQAYEKQQIAANQAEQDRLKNQYANDAEAYAADAEEARRIQADEIAKAIAEASKRAGGRAVVSGGLDSYPYAANCPGANWRYTGLIQTAYGGAVCDCTSYAGWKAQEFWGYAIPWAADAKGWGYMASIYGLAFNSTPAAHTIGVQYAGAWGHVVWIERVNDDGTVDVSEYNNTYSSGGAYASYGYQTGVPASEYYYIHFD